ncbi:integral membrane sensor signal transduction histidine kinase [Paenibacillus curdlanolyticus YK9]|uniref:histidine kinase n=1 Tax=Paenibacillus curdlanolyticus YK9 TaxID=717606 RepID=E0I9F2_9BACL|nr:sensor histidine kinase [Paenibacillus curdlanolyticus]EFM11036.1 integral membrane sensor signal transduction histidine kinase [Paenibacillus curdlanolyticus YK9]
MKKVFNLMDWGIFGLRSYNYALLLFHILMENDYSLRLLVNVVWLLAALIIPPLFWFPQLRKNKEWFILLELLLGGSYYIKLFMQADQLGSVDYLIPSLTIGYLLTRKTVWTLPALLLLPFTSMLFGNVSWDVALGSSSDNFLFAFIGIWVSFIAKAYHEKNKLAKEIDEQNKLLTQYAAEIERMTLLEERNRMSREMHDTLGHSFISLIMSLDAAIALLDGDPNLAKEKLISIRGLTEQNLDNMRDIVHRMGEEENISLVHHAERLVSNFQEYTGTVIRLTLKGIEQTFPFDARQSVLRVIQESFTNALKHGKAKEIELDIRFTPSTLRVFIRNNGKPLGKIPYGFGLTTMKNRIELLGGTFSISDLAVTGVEVRCEIPLKGDTLYAQNESAHRR